MSTTAAGLQIGPWHVGEVLGRGGQATVFRARHAALGRPAAVKLVRHEVWADPAFRLRFVRECDVLASCDHPHVIPVLDAGQHDGRGFLVLRLAERGSLADLCRGGGPSIDEALHILAGVAAALDHLHRRGIVHRDVTPGNVLLDHTGGPWLGDFGLAQSLDATRATGEGVLVGTAAYLAPEVISGGPATAASDRYALAALAYRSLTGRPPHRAPDVASILYAHVHHDPPPVGASDPTLPAALDPVFAAGLARDPRDRPPSARALVGALAAALGRSNPRDLIRVASPPTRQATAILPPPAPPVGEPSTSVLTPRRPRRTRWAVVGACAAVLAGAAAGVGLALGVHQQLPLLNESSTAAPRATTVPGDRGVEVAAGQVRTGDLPEGLVPPAGAVAAGVGGLRVTSLPGGAAALGPVVEGLNRAGLTEASHESGGRVVARVFERRFSAFWSERESWALMAIREPAGERALVVRGSGAEVDAYVDGLAANIGARILPSA